MKNKKPQWVSSFVDQEQYKLSQAELMQKKISLISKHRMEAKDQWQTVQNKLKHNIIDEDTQKIYETALSAKGLSNSTNKRKNLTQMIEWERNQQSMQKSDVLDQAKSLLDMTQNQDKENNFIDKVKNDLESAKTLVARVLKYQKQAQRAKHPERILKSIERSQKSEQVEIKQQTKKDYDFIGLKNLDNVINFLENTLTIEKPQDKMKQTSEPEFQPIKECERKEIIPIIKKQSPEKQYVKEQLQYGQKQIQEQEFEYDYEKNKNTQEFSNPFKNSIINDAQKQKEFEQKLVIENVPKIQMNKNELSFDDNIDQLKQMLELTRMELNQMNLHDPSFLESEQGKEQMIATRSFDVKQMHQKYKNKNTFDIKDHFA